MTLDVIEKHAVFETMNPDLAELEAQEERAREEHYATRNGSLEGYVPRRQFPCLGDLTVTEMTDSWAEVGCSACPFVTMVRPENLRRSKEATW